MMFASLDIKDLTTRIKEKEEELEKPVANVTDFIPLLKNMVMFSNKFKEKEFEFDGLNYNIAVQTHYDYCEELGEEPTEMVNITFEVVRIREEVIYKEQSNIDKFLKRQLVIDRVNKYSSKIMYIAADVNNKHYFENLDEIKIENIEIFRVSAEEFDILYTINNYMRIKLREYFEKKLHELEKSVALKQLSPLPKNISFEG